MNHLNPGRAPCRVKLALQIERTRRVTTDFAAAGFRYALGRDKYDLVRRDAEHRVNSTHNFRFDTAQVFHFHGARFGDDNQALRAAARVHGAKCGDATESYARNVSGRRLHFLRNDVPARLDNKILRAPGNVELILSPISEVSRIHPAVRGGDLGRGLRIAKVTRRPRRAPEEQMPLNSLTYQIALPVHNPDLMVGQWSAVGDKAQNVGIVLTGSLRRHCLALSLKDVAPDN